MYNYNGIRKSKTGKEFMVKDATLWTLVDRDGDKMGQAVKFSKVEFVASKEVYKVAEGGQWVKDDGTTTIQMIQMTTTTTTTTTTKRYNYALI